MRTAKRYFFRSTGIKMRQAPRSGVGVRRPGVEPDLQERNRPASCVVISKLASKFSALTAELSGCLEFAVALGEDGGLAAGELVAGRDVAEGAVKAAGVVVLDEVGGDAASLVPRSSSTKYGRRTAAGRSGPRGFLAQRAIPRHISCGKSL
ncbi:hypothetical protein O0S08_13090 [Nannocystis poenicansa]|uniref:Uncharacterized protein n=1 Tax=Nannocystis punicea TaxID=2995304 RepID=A0ABY7HCQ1_9BACT|nr:hypothetical protein [Nannocystis poenicansa]WAS97076.1 hypothetical protein O0S08_13090 [Nannocystis poenicansa]